MAIVYKPGHAKGYEFCHPDREDDFETISLAIAGVPRREAWKSPTMHLVRKDGKKRLAESNSPWLGAHALIFRRQVLGELEALLSSYGELLPLTCPEADLVIFNATRVLDALDEEASEVDLLPGGRLMAVERYVFRPEMIASVDIFKIPNFRVSPTYVSESFVKRFRAAGLHGLVFRKIWEG